MIINAVVDRIENENAVLVSSEANLEIRIPLSSVEGPCNEGQSFAIILGENLSIVREGEIRDTHF